MIVQQHNIFGGQYDKLLTDFNNLLYVNDVSQVVSMNGSVLRTRDRNGGKNAVRFGLGNLVSVNNLPASAVWSMAFWTKTTQTTNYGIFAELTTNFNSNPPAFFVWHNQFYANRFHAGCNQGLGQNQYRSCNTPINDGLWHHIVVVMDRNQPMLSEISIYIDKVLTTLTHVENYETTGNFKSDKLFIGGRGNSFTSPFVGVLSPIKLFTHALTVSEIEILYNE